MTNPAITQSQKRFQESVGQLFSAVRGNSPNHCLFLKSSTDVGVMRNGGRNGARFAPQSFLSTFRKFSQNEELKKWTFTDAEVSDQQLEESDFHSAQDVEAGKISELVSSSKDAMICHIGGGHDHIYPLLKGVSKTYKSVIVINVDAHADTRTDGSFHSGTPFRQFSETFAGTFELFQVGLHPFANSFSTLTPLSKGKMNILWKKDFSEQAVRTFFKEISDKMTDQTLVVFSIDADALTAAEVPGVSAVNPDGLTRQNLLTLWKSYRELQLQHAPIVGIYELNPVYDSLASISMRTMGSFVFEAITELK